MNDDIRLTYLIKVIKQRLSLELTQVEKELYNDILKMLLDDYALMNEYFRGF